MPTIIDIDSYEESCFIGAGNFSPEATRVIGKVASFLTSHTFEADESLVLLDENGNRTLAAGHDLPAVLMALVSLEQFYQDRDRYLALQPYDVDCSEALAQYLEHGSDPGNCSIIGFKETLFNNQLHKINLVLGLLAEHNCDVEQAAQNASMLQLIADKYSWLLSSLRYMSPELETIPQDCLDMACQD